MNAFEFEAPTPRDAGPAIQKGAIQERELKHVVICETCRGGWLWRVRDKIIAETLGQAHAADTGHTVRVEERDVTRRAGW